MAIQRAEDKTAQMQARAGAIDELLASGALDDPTGTAKDDITLELEQLASTSDVENELAQMKASLGAGTSAAAAGDRGPADRQAQPVQQPPQPSRPARAGPEPRPHRSASPTRGTCDDRPHPRRGPVGARRLALPSSTRSTTRSRRPSAADDQDQLSAALGALHDQVRALGPRCPTTPSRTPT